MGRTEKKKKTVSVLESKVGNLKFKQQPKKKKNPT